MGGVMAYIDYDDVVRVCGDNPPEKPAVDASIAWNSAFIDRTTRQWFESRSLTVYLDGSGSRTILLPVPVISLTSLSIKDESGTWELIASTEYAIYSALGLVDERRNPRIALISRTFPERNQNIKLVGTFGFVEATTPVTTPPMIQRACLKLVLRDLQNPVGNASSGTVSSGSSSSAPVGPIQMENTDGHQIMYAVPRMGTLRSGTISVTGDAEVDSILALYRGPILIGASSGLGVTEVDSESAYT
jgi:hypothetical protein